MLGVLATLAVADVGHLLAWDEADEMALRQRLQDVVTLGLGDASLLGNDALVDIAIVGKQTTIVAQKADDDLVLFGRYLLQTI